MTCGLSGDLFLFASRFPGHMNPFTKSKNITYLAELARQYTSKWDFISLAHYHRGEHISL